MSPPSINDRTPGLRSTVLCATCKSPRRQEVTSRRLSWTRMLVCSTRGKVSQRLHLAGCHSVALLTCIVADGTSQLMGLYLDRSGTSRWSEPAVVADRVMPNTQIAVFAISGWLSGRHLRLYCQRANYSIAEYCCEAPGSWYKGLYV